MVNTAVLRDELIFSAMFLTGLCTRVNDDVSQDKSLNIDCCEHLKYQEEEPAETCHHVRKSEMTESGFSSSAT